MKLKEFILYAVMFIIISLVYKFIFVITLTQGPSMDPTLIGNDLIMIDKITYVFNDINRFDIVAVNKNKYLGKRIIGLPNETIEYRNNILYINDKEMEDPYNFGGTEDFRYELSENEYFVMGDNRLNSLDSRTFGGVNKKEIVGKTYILLDLPFNINFN